MCSNCQVHGDSGVAVSDAVFDQTQSEAFVARGRGRRPSSELHARGRGSPRGGPSRGRGRGLQTAGRGRASFTTGLNSPATPSKPGLGSKFGPGGSPVTPVLQRPEVELEAPLSLTSITVRPMIKSMKDYEITDLFSKAGRILSHSRVTEGISRVSTITFEQHFAVQRIFDRVSPDGYWHPAEWKDWLPTGDRTSKARWARVGKVSIRRVGEPPPSPGHVMHRALGSTGLEVQRSVVTNRALAARASHLVPTQQSQPTPALSSNAAPKASQAPSPTLVSPISASLPKRPENTKLPAAPPAMRVAETSNSKTAVTVRAVNADAGPSKQPSLPVFKIIGQSKPSNTKIASQTLLRLSSADPSLQLSPSGAPLLPGTVATATVSSSPSSERGQCYLHWKEGFPIKLLEDEAFRETLKLQVAEQASRFGRVENVAIDRNINGSRIIFAEPKSVLLAAMVVPADSQQGFISIPFKRLEVRFINPKKLVLTGASEEPTATHQLAATAGPPPGGLQPTGKTGQGRIFKPVKPKTPASAPTLASGPASAPVPAPSAPMRPQTPRPGGPTSSGTPSGASVAPSTPLPSRASNPISEVVSESSWRDGTPVPIIMPQQRPAGFRRQPEVLSEHPAETLLKGAEHWSVRPHTLVRVVNGEEDGPTLAAEEKEEIERQQIVALDRLACEHDMAQKDQKPALPLEDEPSNSKQTPLLPVSATKRALRPTVKLERWAPPTTEPASAPVLTDIATYEGEEHRDLVEAADSSTSVTEPSLPARASTNGSSEPTQAPPHLPSDDISTSDGHPLAPARASVSRALRQSSGSSLPISRIQSPLATPPLPPSESSTRSGSMDMEMTSPEPGRPLDCAQAKDETDVGMNETLNSTAVNGNRKRSHAVMEDTPVPTSIATRMESQRSVVSELVIERVNSLVLQQQVDDYETVGRVPDAPYATFVRAYGLQGRDAVLERLKVRLGETARTLIESVCGRGI